MVAKATDTGGAGLPDQGDEAELVLFLFRETERCDWP